MLLTNGLSLYAQDSAAPDMALLEFLGEGVKVEDEVIDPMTWQAIEQMTGSDRAGQQRDDKLQANRRHDDD
jgi:hypothetical protein